MGPGIARSSRWLARMTQLMGRLDALAPGDLFYSRLTGQWLRIRRVGPDTVVQVAVTPRRREVTGSGSAGTTYLVDRTALNVARTVGLLVDGQGFDGPEQPIDV